MSKSIGPVILTFVRLVFLAILAFPLAFGLWHYSLKASWAQESRKDVTPMLQFRLPEDPYNHPLLRRSLVFDDKELHDLELQVEDYEQRKVMERQRQLIFFEEIERLDNSPFLK